MEKIPRGFVLPSAAFTLQPKQVRYYAHLPEHHPQMGDVVYGRIVYLGQHDTLENKQGRLHTIHDGRLAIFVYGNRYAPDYYESVIPEIPTQQVDLVARSGIIGHVRKKNSLVHDPTKVEVLGYVVDENGQPLNTLNFSKITVNKPHNATKQRAKLILNIGTSMNSGKSTTARSCCWALSTLGKTVRGAKVTGTASLKDILLMEDAGAERIADFTYLGYPSTYLISTEEVGNIFKTMDFKYANNSKNYWVVEFADGILQRETAMLLENPWVRKRIHRLIFSAGDAHGAFGGLNILKDRFDLVPDAISGKCTSSPLGVEELQTMTNTPVFDNVHWNLNQLSEILM